MPVAVVDNVNTTPVIYYVQVDHLMRPARMTDASANWVWDVIFTPFGTTAYVKQNPTVMNARFPGQWFQLETGLAYNWHRHYDATTGRYVQPDPAGLATLLNDGPSVYGYVEQKPVSFTDPWGLATFRLGAIQHIMDRHCTGNDPTAGMFSPEYSNPAALNDLADQILSQPGGSAPGNGNNTIIFGQVLLRDNDTGATMPLPVGTCGCPGPPTNIVAIVVDPRGAIVTMFPASPSYAASRGFSP